jgi:hypothetical protein
VVAFSPSVMFLSHASIAIVAATLFIGAFGERRHPDEDGATGRGAA